MHYTLVRDSPKYGISKQFYLWLTPARPLIDPINALHSGLGFFYQIWWSQGISKVSDLWLTPADPCMILTPAMSYTLIKGSSYQIWWPYGISKPFDLWLIPANPCMTFDPSNAIHSGQGFFPTKFGGHRAFISNLTPG